MAMQGWHQFPIDYEVKQPSAWLILVGYHQEIPRAVSTTMLATCYQFQAPRPVFLKPGGFAST